MEKSVALQRYLQRHVEQGLPRTNACEGTWRQVLVIPVYRESVALLDTLQALPAGPGRSLVILVLNRPDQDTDESANAQLRSAVQSRLQQEAGGTPLLRLNEYSDLFLLDLETLQGATPASEGVGLARKAGCDLALQWMAQGVICGEWICCTDADARVPGDYFEKLALTMSWSTMRILLYLVLSQGWVTKQVDFQMSLSKQLLKKMYMSVFKEVLN